MKDEELYLRKYKLKKKKRFGKIIWFFGLFVFFCALESLKTLWESMFLNIALRQSTAEMLNVLRSTFRQLEYVQSTPIKIIRGIRNLTYNNNKKKRTTKAFNWQSRS